MGEIPNISSKYCGNTLHLEVPRVSWVCDDDEPAFHQLREVAVEKVVICVESLWIPSFSSLFFVLIFSKLVLTCLV